MKKNFSKIFISIFMCILILPSLIWQILKSRPSMTNSFITNEQFENREMASISDPIRIDTITDELEAYYNDRIPFRNLLIQIEHKINGQFNMIYQAEIEPALISLFAPKQNNLSAGNPAIPEIDLTELYPEDLPSIESDVSDSITDSEEDSENENTSDTDTHDFFITEKADATCTEDGYIIYACSDEDCDETKKEIVPAKGHSFEMIEHVDASYLEYGHSIYKCTICKTTYCDDIENKLIDDTYLPPKEGEGNVIQGRFNWLFYSGNNSLDYYQGTNVLTNTKMNNYMQKMQELKNLCDEKGITLCYLVLPNREQVYPEYMPSYNVETTEKRETVLAKYIAANSNITFLYPLNELLASKVYCEPCYPYDTHWNMAGGFIGVQALYKALGLPTTNMLNLDIQKTSFTPRGLVATGALDPTLYTNDFDYIIDYRPEINVLWTDGVDGFLTPTNTFRAKSSNTNNKKLVMIGDSFRIAMIPYLEKDFSEICISHRQDVPNVIKDINEADILVVEAVERFDVELFDILPDLISALKEQEISANN